MRIDIAATALILFVLASGAANAGDRLFRTEHRLSVLGLPAAALKLETDVSADAFRTQGTLATRGIAALFDQTKGTMSVSGRLEGDRIEADRFNIDYVSGNKRQVIDITYSGNRVSRTVKQPEGRKHKDWVPVRSSDLVGALDPFSVLMIPSASFREVCERTLKFYDGTMLADIHLSYLRTIPFSTTGYKGDAVTCKAHFVPVAGYQKTKKEVSWMRDNGNMELTFAPMEGTNVFVLAKAKITTEIGPARIYATRLESVEK